MRESHRLWGLKKWFVYCLKILTFQMAKGGRRCERNEDEGEVVALTAAEMVDDEKGRDFGGSFYMAYQGLVVMDLILS